MPVGETVVELLSSDHEGAVRNLIEDNSVDRDDNGSYETSFVDPASGVEISTGRIFTESDDCCTTNSDNLSFNNNENVNFLNNLNKYNEMNFSLANARSLANKIDSLLDMFKEKDLHFSLITETWFKSNKYTKQELENIKLAENIEFVCKNRGSRGGGVAIAFNNNRASFKPITIHGNKYELVGAVGRNGSDTRKCVLFALYIPPSQTAKDTEGLFHCLADAIEKAKLDYSDPYIVIGGDMNNRDINKALGDFPDIQVATSGPTRGTSTLDIVATNVNSYLEIETFHALETFDGGTTSDHLTIVGAAKLPSIHYYTTSTYQSRQYSPDAEEAFGAELTTIDWSKAEGNTPSESAEKKKFILQYLYNKHFPLKTIKSRSCDPPWITKRIRRYIRNRKREYSRSGRSARWKKKKDICDKMIQDAKKAFFERVKKIVKEAGNTKSYFAAIRLLHCVEAPVRWQIQSMFPGLSDDEIAERAAVFFNAISQEY